MEGLAEDFLCEFVEDEFCGHWEAVELAENGETVQNAILFASLEDFAIGNILQCRTGRNCDKCLVFLVLAKLMVIAKKNPD